MKKLFMIGGGSALLVISILFGTFFATPLLASANTNTAAASTPTKDTYCDQFQQNLAKRLNVSVSTLQQDRKGAFEDTLNQMVKDGKLTQAQADTIKKRVESRKDCKGFRAARVQRGVSKQFLQKYRSDITAQIAQGLNLSSDQLTAQLKSGKSLNQIAQAQKVSTDNLKTIVTNAVNSSLTKATSAGDLTQTQANDFKQFLQKHPRFVKQALFHAIKQQKK